ncbi:MAG: MerR family DNA-binding transcriptional regulator [Geodermatophilaceae bacterium]
MAGDVLTIGQLARRSGLTTKALRHYDRLGLLRPASVDPVNGYRLEARSTRVRGALHTLDHLVSDEWSPTMTDPRPVPRRRRTTAVRRPVQRRLAAAGEGGPVHRRGRPDAAHGARLPVHWENVGTAANLARGEWQCSRVYAVLRRPEPALFHAQRVIDHCKDNGIADWDLAFGYEALARGHAVAGDVEAARAATEQALAAVEEIAEEDDRSLVLGDLGTIPGQPRFW